MSCGPTRAGSVVTLSANGLLNDSLRAVPYAGDAAHLAVLAQRADGGWAVALVKRRQC